MDLLGLYSAICRSLLGCYLGMAEAASIPPQRMKTAFFLRASPTEELPSSPLQSARDAPLLPVEQGSPTGNSFSHLAILTLATHF